MHQSALKLAFTQHAHTEGLLYTPRSTPNLSSKRGPGSTVSCQSEGEGMGMLVGADRSVSMGRVIVLDLRSNLGTEPFLTIQHPRSLVWRSSLSDHFGSRCNL